MFPRFGFHITPADLVTGLLILGILLATAALASHTTVIDAPGTVENLKLVYII